MTETLARLLQDRADEVRFDAIDLDAVTRAGSRTLRRRRWTAAGAAATVLAVSALAAVPWRDDRQEPSTMPTETTGLTWASGTVVHTPSGDIDVGHQVSAYVRTSVGYVVTDGQQVYSVTGDEVRAVGSIESPEPSGPTLVGDADGSVAAWPDGSEYVVLDQQTGDVHRVFSSPYPRLVTADGRRLYVSGDNGSFTIDVDSGVVEPVRELGRYFTPVDAQDDTLLTVDDAGGLVARGPDGVELLMSAAPDTASLSPDGQRAAAGFSTASGPVLTFDLRTGAISQLPLSTFTAYPYEWLDDDTVVLLSLPTASAHYQLLTCTVSRPACTVAVPDLGEGRDDGGNGVRFALPIGEPFFPYPHD
jgi:hypothetical protein